jgi:cytochrome c peroxidase
LPSQFWDGRRATLEEQALDQLLKPREHVITDQIALALIVRTDDRYRA